MWLSEEKESCRVCEEGSKKRSEKHPTKATPMGGAIGGAASRGLSDVRSVPALGSEWGARSARHGAEGRVGESVPHVDTHKTSNAPVDDLLPAELAGACPAPIRCLALASPSPVSFSSVCPSHPEVRTPGLRSARGTRQLYRAGS